MTTVAGEWLSNPATQLVAQTLSDGGYQVFFVGGCVRNAALGVAVSDIDMCTDAPPERVTTLCKQAGLKTIPTGFDHGTVTVVSDSIAHEITTFRKDVTTDGRHAAVAFSTSIEDDVIRRDFTMNALYADPAGVVFDPVNGMPDLIARRVRFVGEPTDRIREDALRILRFFRFHAWYGDPSGGIDRDGLAACASNIDALSGLSRERVGAEMVKLLSAPDPAPAVAAMAQSGVLQAVMPGADPKALAPLIHFETDSPDWRRRAAVLGGDNLQDNWRLAKKDAAHLNILRDAIGSMDALGSLAYYHGDVLARNAAFGRSAIFETPPPADFETEIQRGSNARFPVKAADIPTFQGKELGDKLKELEQTWIASDFAMSKTDLLAL